MREPVLRTERLVLRPLEMADREAMVDAVMSDNEVMYWLPYSHAVSTPEGQQAVALGYLEEFVKPWQELGIGVWAVCGGDNTLGEAGAFLGYCGFLPEKLEGAGPEIAYAVRRSVWGKGVVTEALGACLDWVFTRPGISRVHAVTDADNLSSRRVMEKAGMTHEKNVDLYDSVAKGLGLLPLYSLHRCYRQGSWQ